MKVLGIIPARYGSTRFPGKPLIDILGKSMIQRVYEEASKCVEIESLIVATDDDRIFEHVQSFGGKVMMTSNAHQSGTDRCNEVLSSIDELFDVVINIQGDEPVIDPAQLSAALKCFENTSCNIATLVKKIDSSDLLFDSSKIKVTLTNSHEALYFSRQPIPFQKLEKEKWLNGQVNYWKHIGIYAYRAETLPKLAALTPTMLEQAESLEQLRWLENGYRIQVAHTEIDSISVDIPKDLERVTSIIKQRES